MYRATTAVFALLVVTPIHAGHFEPKIELTPIGTYSSGIFDESAAEIVAYDRSTRRVFVVNANDATVDVLDVSDPTNPVKVATIDVTAAAESLGAANSLDVSRGILAVAVERDPQQANGIVSFYNTRTLALLGVVEVGALPDMLMFTPNGKFVVVANEGQPDDDYVVDPEGSISVIDIRRGVHRARVKTADFSRFNDKKDQLLAKGVRIYGPNASVAQDMEPEYVALDARGRTAYVTLQENNAVAVVDVYRARVKKILPLGAKDHSLPGNEMDASNRDDAINIRNWPVRGLYQPDSIATYRSRGKTYFVTANEGDSRDYDGFSEEVRIKDLEEDEGKVLDPSVFPDAAALLADEQLGRLKITNTLGDADGDGQMESLYSYGARSFSIWDSRGRLVWDSGSDFEWITANHDPDNFNSTNDENNSFDDRSDDKGPEPEAVVIGRFLGRTFAFVGLERVGGIMVYDISNPRSPRFVSYTNNRDFSVEDPTDPAIGDLGPEGLEYVPWYRSPNWRPLLIVGNEVTGTTTIYQIDLAN